MRGLLLTGLACCLLALAPPARAGASEEVQAVFERFVAAQNAHDLAAVGSVLLDRPDFLWITRGTAVWGRDAALQRFEALYKGTWRLDPDPSGLKVIELGAGAAQLMVPITFMIAPAGQAAQPARFLMNQTLVSTAQGWKIASILPIPLPP